MKQKIQLEKISSLENNLTLSPTVHVHASDHPTLKEIWTLGNQALWRVIRGIVRHCFLRVGWSSCIGRIVRPSGCRIIRSHSVFPVFLLHLISLRWVGHLVSTVHWTSSKGPRKSYKYDLTNSLVPLIALSLDHQNHSKWLKWGNVRYNVSSVGVRGEVMVTAR